MGVIRRRARVEEKAEEVAEITEEALRTLQRLELGKKVANEYMDAFEIVWRRVLDLPRIKIEKHNGEHTTVEYDVKTAIELMRIAWPPIAESILASALPHRAVEKVLEIITRKAEEE